MPKNLSNDTILSKTYKIERELGHGAFGEVYLAKHLSLGTYRAIKVIRKGENGLGSTEFSKYRDRFTVEARLGDSIHHPNIIRVVDFIEENGELFLIMDYAPGGSLADEIVKAKETKSPLPIKTVIQWVLEAANGLEQLHNKDIVHRDIKPSNILIDSADHACIADLGLVQLSTSRSDGSSFGSNHPGTPEYMPPEQQPGNYMPLRASADVYALGCVLFELLTGSQYYHRPEGTSVRSIRTDTPIWLDKVVNIALLPDSKARFMNAGEFADSLQALGGDRPFEKNGPPENINNNSEKKGDENILHSLYTGKQTDQEKITAIKEPNKKIIWLGIIGIVIVALITILVLNSGKMNVKTLTGNQTDVTLESTILSEISTPTSTVETQINSDSANGVIKKSQIDEMKMVEVPAGDFIMGSLNGEGSPDEHPQHTVYLDAYSIDQTEVTNAMFSKFVENTGYITQAEKVDYSYYYQNNSSVRVVSADWAHPVGPASSINDLENNPVVNVSWEDAAAYCAWAGKRLPTEAEWEKAARGTDGRTYPWGNQLSCSMGNFDDETIIDSFTILNQPNCDGFSRTSPVGSFIAGKSPYGALDMAGNVWEWVNDWYSKNYYTENNSNYPQGPSSSDVGRVLRGGSWYTEENFLRSAYRDANHPLYTNDSIGFRCASSEQ
jgi:serine/threonine-protein kinase